MSPKQSRSKQLSGDKGFLGVVLVDVYVENVFLRAAEKRANLMVVALFRPPRSPHPPYVLGKDRPVTRDEGRGRCAEELVQHGGYLHNSRIGGSLTRSSVFGLNFRSKIFFLDQIDMNQFFFQVVF
jgi:hypothetical protein